MKSTRMHLARAAVPVVALGALMASGTGTATAVTTWWYSSGPHGSGAAATFREQGDQLRVCDVNSDGYRALVDVQTAAGAHVYRVTDSYNDNRCTTVSAADGRHNIAEKRSYRLRVCVINTGQRPSYCKTSDPFYNDH
ncbi:hypothetical protein OG883_46225 [Streptomyces sp. NBC_01142]|uniref:hypothetical protein n=1 Tax=Streptomyces sp. NBC_01142 TaxID=2975865 RepID=UPI0022537B5B|nr:hypothetical protein [Streptomyces sp. NBC_01142]MCX4827038.1 hypothetical protein [Streptomyces sp. NBC_01142]